MFSPPRFRLQREQFLPRPVPEAFAFFAEAANLQAITPEFLDFRILTPLPLVLREGALLDYRLRLFGMPFGWRTRIESWEPPARFTDRQLRGPYALWHHTHEFRAVPGGTAMTDVVDYELPLGPLGHAAHGLVVQRTLARIFDYRRDRIAELLASGTAQAGARPSPAPMPPADQRPSPT